MSELSDHSWLSSSR